MKLHVTKEWCERSADIEGNAEVGAGCPPTPCPQLVATCDCITWARTFDGTYDKGTNHHPRCPNVDDSLIDVWRVEYDGDHYYSLTDPPRDDMDPEEVVTKERMHRELFDRLPEFSGF